MKATRKVAKSISKHFKHHSELPMRLDKYLMMFNGFPKSKASEFISAPKLFLRNFHLFPLFDLGLLICVSSYHSLQRTVPFKFMTSGSIEYAQWRRNRLNTTHWFIHIIDCSFPIKNCHSRRMNIGWCTNQREWEAISMSIFLKTEPFLDGLSPLLNRVPPIKVGSGYVWWADSISIVTDCCCARMMAFWRIYWNHPMWALRERIDVISHGIITRTNLVIFGHCRLEALSWRKTLDGSMPPKLRYFIPSVVDMFLKQVQSC